MERASPHDGALVMVWSYSGTHNQQWRLRSLSTTGRTVAGAAEPDGSGGKPDDGIRLFPNPATGRTTLTFAAAAPQAVKILLTNATGRTVNALTPYAHAGDNQADVDLSDLRPGLYTLQLLKDNQVLTRKLIVAK